MDARVRELERRWRQSGSADDHERWLREAVRTGAIEKATVEAAAYLGSEVARRLLADEGFVRPADALDDFVERLVIWSASLQVRAHTVAARRALDALAAFAPPEARAALEAAEAWCACPCADHGDAARLAAGAIDAPRGWVARPTPAMTLLRLTRRAAEATADGKLPPGRGHLGEALEHGWAHGLRHQEVRAAIVSALLPGLIEDWRRPEGDTRSALSRRERGLPTKTKAKKKAPARRRAPGTRPGPALPADDLEPAAWFEALETMGKPACVAAVVEVARSLHPGRRASGASRQAIAAAEAWLSCPCDPHRLAARPLGKRPASVEGVAWPARAALAAARAAGAPDERGARTALREVVPMLLRTLGARQLIGAKGREPPPVDWSLPALRLAREGVRRWVRR